MASKQESRLRRSRKTRARIKDQGIHRLTVHKTSKHMYAQVFTSDGSQVVAAVSTVQKQVSEGLDYTGNIKAAAEIGRLIAEKAMKAGIKAVAFDRSGHQYHGRVKALADAAREQGLSF